MDKEQLKELIQAVYDDHDFADFNLHFVNCVEPHKVYEIKNNRINNKLKDTTLVSINSEVTNKMINQMSLYNVDVKEHLVRTMIEESANKILTDIYKVNSKDWFYNQKEQVKVELSITNWNLFEEVLENKVVYKLRFEIA
jgi:hypothetical protein